MQLSVDEENASQGWLITPKLLPDLDFHEKMKVLIVFNGPSMVPHDEYSLSDILAARRRLRRS